MSVFNTLYTKGFCKREDEGEPEQGEGTEMGSGTGLGSGKGEKDISDQIEDEEDLLGRKEACLVLFLIIHCLFTTTFRKRKMTKKMKRRIPK